MSDATHPNPAEVCLSRNWQGRNGDEPGTMIREGEISREIVLIDDREGMVVTKRSTDGMLHIWTGETQASHIRDAWTKAEPTTTVRIKGTSDDLAIFIDDSWAFSARSWNSAFSHLGADDVCDVVRIGAEAMKAKVEELLGKGKAAIEGDAKTKGKDRYTEERPGTAYRGHTMIHRDGKPCIYVACPVDTDPAEITADMRRLIDAGLAALNGDDAEAEATEGPFRAVRHTSGVWQVILNESTFAAKIVTSFTTDDMVGFERANAIAQRHAREIASELNALHAKSKAE